MISTIQLNDGNKIPQLGIGVFQVPPGEQTKKVCLEALKLGYRHIDTAHAYLNEQSVGEAIKESGIPREELYITTKLWPTEYGEGKTAEGINKMLRKLGTNYIDLLLLHQPIKDCVGAWKDMEKAVHEGKVRSIGLSNFDLGRLDEILAICTIKPSVLQVECHPYFQQKELIQKINEFNCALECWYPIGHGDKALIEEPIFTKLSEKYHKSNVQIILRWHIQEKHIIFPRASNPLHIKENMEIFDFNLEEEEMEQIRKIDKKVRYFTVPFDQLEDFLKSFDPQ